jgi:hypothetical protein
VPKVHTSGRQISGIAKAFIALCFFPVYACVIMNITQENFEASLLDVLENIASSELVTCHINSSLG